MMKLNKKNLKNYNLNNIILFKIWNIKINNNNKN